MQRGPEAPGTPVTPAHQLLELVALEWPMLLEGLCDDRNFAIELFACPRSKAARIAGRAEHAGGVERVSIPWPETSKPVTVSLETARSAKPDPLLTLGLRQPGILGLERFDPRTVLGRVDPQLSRPRDQLAVTRLRLVPRRLLLVVPGASLQGSGSSRVHGRPSLVHLGSRTGERSGGAAQTLSFGPGLFGQRQLLLLTRPLAGRFGQHGMRLGPVFVGRGHGRSPFLVCPCTLLGSGGSCQRRATLGR